MQANEAKQHVYLMFHRVIIMWEHRFLWRWILIEPTQSSKMEIRGNKIYKTKHIHAMSIVNLLVIISSFLLWSFISFISLFLLTNLYVFKRISLYKLLYWWVRQNGQTENRYIKRKEKRKEDPLPSLISPSARILWSLRVMTTAPPSNTLSRPWRTLTPDKWSAFPKTENNNKC